MLGLGALQGGSQRPGRPRDQERRASLLHAATNPPRSHPGSLYPNASKKGEADSGVMGKRAAHSPLRFPCQSARFRSGLRQDLPADLLVFVAEIAVLLGPLQEAESWPSVGSLQPTFDRNPVPKSDVILGAEVLRGTAARLRRCWPHFGGGAFPATQANRFAVFNLSARPFRLAGNRV